MSSWVLLSGAGGGIGRSIALKLVRRGFSPILVGRSRESLEATVSTLDGAVHRLIVADVRDRLALREGLAACQITKLHGVVANAGVGGENHYGQDDRWDEIIETNLTGCYNLAHEALPYLRAQCDDGEYRHLVFMSSILARLGVPGYQAYCASKAGLLGLMRSMAAEYAKDKILVNAVCPGWVNTNMARDGIRNLAQKLGRSFEEVHDQQMAMVPLGKMSEPREVAELIYFLLSRVQGSITGQTFDMNNGALMP